ncbi:hypothetical protein MC885_019846 [Smutsia gigantea]|nr:hypothetical protein MC885_019846 [Smutsia gigantea]
MDSGRSSEELRDQWERAMNSRNPQANLSAARVQPAPEEDSELPQEQPPEDSAGGGDHEPFGSPAESMGLAAHNTVPEQQGAGLAVLDLRFTELSDELLRPLMPSLWALPCLSQLLLNGIRLTWATAREFTKDTTRFPTLA